MKISVALAAYNGGKYIGEQLDSILPQLGESDEIIISDDLPSGDTEKTVEFYREFDSRVKYLKGPGKGVIKNFENAVNAASGDIIFLCDQDDVWLPNKVKRVVSEFEGNLPLLVLHDARVTDGNLNVTAESFFALNSSKPGFLHNLIKNSYMGCCMAFDKRLKSVILPFPEDIPMHDQWIGLTAELCGRVSFINEPLLLYRRHDETVTGRSKSSLKQKLHWRFRILREVIAVRNKEV